MTENSTPKKPSVIRDSCGTTAGYQKHKTYKEAPCDICYLARNEYDRVYRLLNGEKVRARARKWKSKNKDKVKSSYLKTRDVSLAKAALYRSSHRAELNEKQKIYRENNIRKIKEAKKRYSLSNPEKPRAAARRRRAKIRQNGHEIYTEAQVLEKYGPACHICTEQIDIELPRHQSRKGWERGLHIDHLIPIAKGGPDTLENVRPSHAICNIKKGAK